MIAAFMVPKENPKREYIDREALLERIDDIWDCADMVFEPNDKCCRPDDCASCKWAETKRAIRKIVEYFPAADVRPVVRGEWISEEHTLHDGTPGYSIKCSVCREVFTEVDLRCVPMKTNFCPNCGAKMEES